MIVIGERKPCAYFAALLPLHQVERAVEFTADCTLRVLRIFNSSTGDSHLLSHYHFHAWPDHGAPRSSGGIRAICAALSPVRASSTPILVHCSAGIGRTGTFCALDIVLQQLDSWSNQDGGITEGEVVETLDLPSLVAKLRQQRMNMVQTLEQYEFLYKAILEDLQQRVERAKGAAAAAGHANGGFRFGGNCQ